MDHSVDGPVVSAVALPPGRQKRSFRFVFALIFGAAALNLLVVGIVALTLQQGMEQRRKQAEDSAQNLATVLDENITGLIGRIDVTLLAVRDEVEHQLVAGGIDAEAISALLARHDARIPDALGLRVVDAAGAVRHAVNGVVVRNASIADRPQFIRMRDDPKSGLVISEPLMGRSSQQWIITLSRRVNNPDGSFGGDVHVSVALGYFSGTFASLKLGRGGAVSFWNDTPTILARYVVGGGLSSQPGGIAPSPELKALVDSRAHAGTYFATSAADGVMRTFAFRRVGDLPFFLTVGIAEDEYLAEWRQEAWQRGGLTLLFILSTATAAWVLERGWRRQIRDTVMLQQAKEEAEAARLRSELVLTSAGEGIYGIDASGRLLFINPAARRFLGISDDTEVIGQLAHALNGHCSADGRPCADDSCHVIQTIHDGIDRQSDNEFFRHPDGTLFPVELSANAMVKDGVCTGAVVIFRDITDRKATEQALQENQSRLQTLLDTASDGVHILDERGNVIEFSQSFSRLLGYSPEVTARLNVADWDAQIPNETLIDRLQALIREPATFETKHRREDGSVFDAEINAKGIVLGGRRYLYASSRDITARKQAEAAKQQAQAELQETLARLNLILKTAAEGIIGIDDKRRVIFANPAAATILARSLPEAMVGKPVHDVTGHVLADGSSCLSGDCRIRTSLVGGDTVRVTEESFTRADGLIFPVEYVVSPLVVSDQVVGAVFVFHDITERKRVENEIAQLLAKLRAILANTPIGIAIIDLNRFILEANEAFSRVYGRERQEIIGQSVRILYGDPAQYEDIGARAYPLVHRGETFQDDVPMVRCDGAQIWVRLVAHLVDVRNPDLGVVWAAEDITGSKALELDLKRSNAELEQFAYVASHDLRQPLRMISSYLGVIEKRLGPELSEELKGFLGYATGGARRMDRMITDLLEYSRTGRSRENFEPVALNDAIGDSLISLESAIKDADGEVRVADGLPVLTANRSELVRLFQNLIGNAVKYRHPARTPLVEIGHGDLNGELVVWVKDNGMGISPDQRERAFAIFQRLVAKDAYEGSGIGLSVCRKIVENHGGRIWIEDAPDGGCVFMMTFPELGTP